MPNTDPKAELQRYLQVGRDALRGSSMVPATGWGSRVGHGRASSTRCSGVSVARRNRVKPAARTTSPNVASGV